MSVSVVIRTKDHADRLRLALASLRVEANRRGMTEVVVVDDGSSDHTAEVLAEAASDLPLVVVTHAEARGRSAASNAGAAAASGATLLFLDGDVLAAPGMIARHAEAHAGDAHVVARGEGFHLRCTRFLLDPEHATPRPGEEARIARLPAHERERLRVTLAQVRDDFASIERRAEPAIYPGVGPRRLYELEMGALRNHPDSKALWIAASGHNLSVRRAEFLEVGGFDLAHDLVEQRELALRLCNRGARMIAIDGARSFHLTHRVGWRDPLASADWEARLRARHPIPEVELLAVLWASLADVDRIPREAKLESFEAFERAARGETSVDYEAVRRALWRARGSEPQARA